MTVNEQIWIETGYAIFAEQGATHLKIEPLAKKVGISKSSFYHHFADMEVFISRLLEFHLAQAAVMAAKERAADTIDPELINILIAHKTDLLFNRQLRIHQQNKVYKDVLIQANQIIGNEFVRLWASDLRLNLSHRQLSGLFELALENFYLQINAEHLNYRWLSDYFRQLKRIAQNFA